MTTAGLAENDSTTPLDIAVVGAGISGMAAAWLLAKASPPPTCSAPGAR